MDSDGERGGAARPLQASASLPASVNDTIHSAANRWLKASGDWNQRVCGPDLSRPSPRRPGGRKLAPVAC